MRENLTSTNVGKNAVGYVRVSTDMQAADGLSLEAQREAIRAYCASQGIHLVRIYQDVESGGKADRAGLVSALRAEFDVLIVLKFDRLSRSIKHFCEIYEEHFASGAKELVAIRESIRLDSALGRALVSILLVFAQMEREATGERTRESIAHIRRLGYFFGKVPYGKKSVPAPDNPRYRVLVDNEEEQNTLARIKGMLDSGQEPTEIANTLNSENVLAPQRLKWTGTLVYKLKVRKGWHKKQPVNVRNHTDEEAKRRMHELRDKGTTHKSIANILNEEGYLPYKGQRFTTKSVGKLLGSIKETLVLTPRAFCESIIRRENGDRPSYPKLAMLLSGGGFQTPRGNTHWWPAQVQQLLSGVYDEYYRSRQA